MKTGNEAIDRIRRRACTNSFNTGMASVDWSYLQAMAQADPDVPKPEKVKGSGKRAQKKRLRAAQNKLAKVRSEQGAIDYYLAGDAECICQIITYK